MAEILTESFCERCGTRYTFQAAGPRRRGIGRIRTLTRGVKNFVVNDNASFAEAMEAAREDDERTASAQQLDAFHETFNFCMSCRQYTCRNCWNSSAGECLSCAPDLSLEVLPPPFPHLAVVDGPAAGHESTDAPAWPTSDLRPALLPALTEVPSRPTIHAARANSAELAESSPGAAEGGATTHGTDLELTPDELSAIRDALARHVGPPAESPPAPPDSVTLERVEPRLDLDESVVPIPVDATPAAPAEPLAEARAETRRLLRRFRPGREEATTASPVPAMRSEGEAAEPEPVVAAVETTEARAATRDAGAAVQEVTPASPPEVAEPEAEARVSPAEPEAAEPFSAGSTETTEALSAGSTEATEPEAHEPQAAEPGAAEPAKSVEPAESVEAGPLEGADRPQAAEPAESVEAGPLEGADRPQAAEPAESVEAGPLEGADRPQAAEPAAAEPAPPPADHVAQPTWRMIAPDGALQSQPGPPAWGTPTVAGRRAADAVPSAPWAARVAAARSLESPVWDVSSRDILSAPVPDAGRPVGVQSCVTCGLSLSANARFCRRCGTRQG